MAEILITSDSRYLIDRKSLRKAIDGYLENVAMTKKVEVSVAVVGARKMKELNKKYRQIDKATNVLSFPLEEGAGGEVLSFGSAKPQTGSDGQQNSGFVFPDDGRLYLGDVVLCYPVLRKQAGEYKLMVDDWVNELAVHGLEHLLGKHHE